ncbi:MAG: DNA repair protein RecN [Oscillospiraceae bacterium]|nr:DNA repair protein RecN [Oscillospiraceae bacterium]
MLRELAIENLAVIEKASAQFGGNFNVFTGETGAGKSILIGGINAILGQRTNKDIVRTGSAKAVITALFDDIPQSVTDKLAEMGFAAEDGELMLMREISADGKSSARINGRTATAAMLREIGSMLVDVHGQHENRILMSADNQRDILDSYGGIAEVLSEYREKFRSFSQVSKRISKLRSEDETRSLKIARLTAIVEELEALDISKGEGEALEAELAKCRNFVKIQSALYSAYNSFNGEETAGALDQLRRAMNTLNSVSSFMPEADALAKRIEDLLPEAEDIAAEIASHTNDDSGAAREAALEDRVSALKHAKRRYNMDADQLVDYLDECRSELMELDGADSEIEDLLIKKHDLGEEVKRAAEEITTLRTKAAARLSEEICEQLKFLDMPNVRIIISVSRDKVTINGMDSVEMLISANAGEAPKPISRIASGGELSRIMLAIKSVLADNDDIPTLIFDEVDAGISGRAAQKVGIKLAQTARKRQVLCITHLAQIASQADHHLLIEKNTQGERTFTRIEILDFEGRRAELARIIDGEGSSESSLQAAEEMLRRNVQ